MNYQELKAKHSKQITDFQGLFFAFSQEQLNDGLLKIGFRLYTSIVIYHGKEFNNTVLRSKDIKSIASSYLELNDYKRIYFSNINNIVYGSLIN